MEIGLHIADFTFPGGPAGLRDDLTRIVTTAEEAGFEKVSVMDHLWQIGLLGPPEHEMLEAYTTLAYLAARTSKVDLVSWVTAVVYREPGMLAKLVTTLDVLSGGRAWLGIGAAWNDHEAHGLGLPFPPTAERFERLEETLQICLQMWSENDGPYNGKHYQLERTLNSPQALTQAAPADPDRRRRREEDAAAGREVRAGLQPVPRRRSWRTSWTCCASTACGRAATTTTSRRPSCWRSIPGERGENIDSILESLQKMAALGISHAHGIVPGVWKLDPLTTLGREVVPAIADW